MTAPATYQTAQQIIRLAYKDAGIIQDGDEPNGEQYADAMLRLADMVNLWQTQGLRLWTIQDVEVPLVVGQAEYTLSPTGDVEMVKPLRAPQAYFLDADGNRTPLNPLSRSDWTLLSQTTQSGALNSFFVDKRATELAVSFWLIPDATAATGTAHLVLQAQQTQLIHLTDATGFPVEWNLALRWGLADELCVSQPERIAQRCATKAVAYRTMLEDWDVEDASTRFSLDFQGTHSSKF